jgi:basic membrane protein A
MKGVNEKGLEFATTEMLPQSDWEATFRDYASKGFDLVIGTDSGMDAASKVVAADFPNTFFLIDSGRFSNGTNAGALAIAEWQEGVLGGTVMANLTKSKKIGFIGGTDDPVIVAVATGIKSVATKVDPTIEVLSSYVGSWTDVQKAKELAGAMMDAGADFIMPKADAGSVAAIQLAAERGIFAVGSTGDMTSVAPDFVVASARAMNDVAVYKAVILFAEGKLKPEVIVMGAAEGVVDIVWNPKFQALYPAVYDLTQQVMKDLISGKITEPVAP